MRSEFSFFIPQPWSVTSNLAIFTPRSMVREMQIEPLSLNFMELVRRLTSTCLRRASSVTNSTSAFSLQLKTKEIGFLHVTSTDSSTDLQSRLMLHVSSSRLILPLSIFERSSTSLMRFSRASEFSLMMLLKWFFSSSVNSSPCLARRLEKPTMAFSGVRISWLMLARKADFMRLASSALFLATSSSLPFWMRASFILLSFTT